MHKVTTQQIGKHLKKFGWDKFQELPEPNEDQGIVLTAWDGHGLFIDPMVEKGALSFTARGVAKGAPDQTPADRLNALLLAMNALNYKMIIGSWAYDPTDGEVVFKVALPIDSGDLEYSDFAHALRVLVMSVETQGPELNAILNGTKTAQEVIQAF